MMIKSSSRSIQSSFTKSKRLKFDRDINCALLTIPHWLSFCADFGPFNLAMSYRFCMRLKAMLQVSLGVHGQFQHGMSDNA